MVQKYFAVIVNNLLWHIHAQKQKKARQKDKLLPVELLEKRIKVTVIFLTNLLLLDIFFSIILLPS